MDPSRIESYLRCTCSVLDFDIGELWCARKLPGQTPELNFIHLYTSPTYEDFHSLLVQPESDTSGDEDKHSFSPVICRGVCDGGQIVWANTRISQGLTGRSDLPLNTAVGVPICSIGHDLYILVLFAVGLINMNPHAVEYLTTVARAVTEGPNGFLNASRSSSVKVSPAKTEDFVGVWDISELVMKYSQDVEFHVLPMGKLQKFFDCHEILLFCDLFMDFKMSRDGRFTTKQLETIRETYRNSRERSDSVSSETSKNWDLDNSSKPITPRGLQKDGFRSESELENTNGAFNVDLNSLEFGGEFINSPDSPQFQRILSKSDLVIRDHSSNRTEVSRSILHIYAHMTYRLSQCRFHEFMIAILGMTVFEAAELWLVSEKTNELFLVAAVYRSGAMQKWIALSETLRLKIGTDGPGKIVENSQSHWDSEFSKLTRENQYDPRANLARELGINTAFGIPLPGMNGICGSVMFYSSKVNFTAEPLLILMIERAVNLMASSSLESAALAKIDAARTVADYDSPTSSSVKFNDPSSTTISRLPNKFEQALVSKSLPPDFDRKLELCRSLVHNKEYVYSKLNQEPSGKDSKENNPIPDDDFINDQGDPVYTAAYTLASFGKAQLKSLIESRQHSKNNLAGMASNNNLNGMTNSQSNNHLSRVQELDSAINGLFSLSNPPTSGNSVNSTHSSEWHDETFFKESYLNSFQQGVYSPMEELINRSMLELQSRPQTFPFPINTSNFNTSKTTSSSKAKAQPKATATPPPSINPNPSLTTSDSASISIDKGLNKCKVDECDSCVESNTALYCAAHRNIRRCQKEGCTKCAQGATKYCIAHGGGRRCTFPGCYKGARDKFFCAAHGGGKRCTQQGCSKSAVGGSNLCTAHGGGKRCQFPGCNKSSQSSTNFCVRHGGGRSCMHPGCTKVARGKTNYCAAHGGGTRCRVMTCNKLAVGSQQLCRTHAQNAASLDPNTLRPKVAQGTVVTDDEGDEDDLDDDDQDFSFAGKASLNDSIEGQSNKRIRTS